MSQYAATYRERVYEYALDHHGHIAAREAEEIGVPAVELRKLAHRGFAERVGHGVYRVRMVPRSATDEYAEAVAMAGRDAYLRADAVLAMLDLAPVNPRKIRVGTPHRVRRMTLPPTVDVTHEAVSEDQLTEYDGVRATTVERAVLDSVGVVMTSRLLEVVARAGERGLLDEAARRRLRRALRGRTRRPQLVTA